MACRVHILLYRGRGLLNALIRWQTRGAFAHAAIWVDGTVYESKQWKGVLKRKSTPEDDIAAQRFEVAHLTGNDTAVAEMVAWLEKHVGKPYDYLSVLRFLSRRQESCASRGKWFCSELVFAALQKAGVQILRRTQPWEVSPQLLCRSPQVLDISPPDTR